ncbi:MAG: leucine-rich repeat domain-containing protein [Candidatus Hodarchaeales archaeon]
MIVQTIEGLLGIEIYFLYIIIFGIGIGIYLWRFKEINRILSNSFIYGKKIFLWVHRTLFILGGTFSRRGTINAKSTTNSFTHRIYIMNKFPSLDTEQREILTKLISNMGEKKRDNFCENRVEIEEKKIVGLDLSTENLTIFIPDICNKLKSIPPNIGYLKNLERLDLRDNQITSVNPKLGILEKLKTLDLSYNQLETFPPWEYGLPNLVSLNINNNSLTTVLNSLGNMKNLESIYLNSNKLSFLPESLLNLQKLQSLDIRNNQLISIPSALSTLPSLKEFHFDN